MIGSNNLLCTVAKKPNWSHDTTCVVHYAAVSSSICCLAYMEDQLPACSYSIMLINEYETKSTSKIKLPFRARCESCLELYG